MKGEKESGCPKCGSVGGTLIQCPLKDWYKMCPVCGYSTPHFKTQGEANSWWEKATA